MDKVWPESQSEHTPQTCPWLRQLDDIILGHGVSLLQWRSGGVEHPHDTPPYPFTPSPTSAHNSHSVFSDRFQIDVNVLTHKWFQEFFYVLVHNIDCCLRKYRAQQN
jgi:hypothetical protein